MVTPPKKQMNKNPAKHTMETEKSEPAPEKHSAKLI